MPAKTEDTPANDNARPVRLAEQPLQEDPAQQRRRIVADEAERDPHFSPDRETGQTAEAVASDRN